MVTQIEVDQEREVQDFIISWDLGLALFVWVYFKRSFPPALKLRGLGSATKKRLTGKGFLSAKSLLGKVEVLRALRWSNLRRREPWG